MTTTVADFAAWLQKRLADDRQGGTMTVQCRKGKDDRPDECCGECAVDPLVIYDQRQDLQCWFGLSYASWLTLPRVLMEAMPEE